MQQAARRADRLAAPLRGKFAGIGHLDGVIPALHGAQRRVCVRVRYREHVQPVGPEGERAIGHDRAVSHGQRGVNARERRRGSRGDHHTVLVGQQPASVAERAERVQGHGGDRDGRRTLERMHEQFCDGWYSLDRWRHVRMA